jgi:hypothetical protein
VYNLLEDGPLAGHYLEAYLFFGESVNNIHEIFVLVLQTGGNVRW